MRLNADCFIVLQGTREEWVEKFKSNASLRLIGILQSKDGEDQVSVTILVPHLVGAAEALERMLS